LLELRSDPTIDDGRHEGLKAMLNERQTLIILGWGVGTVCLAIFTLSALAMP
jgi:hypothetical protein